MELNLVGVGGWGRRIVVVGCQEPASWDKGADLSQFRSTDRLPLEALTPTLTPTSTQVDFICTGRAFVVGGGIRKLGRGEVGA